MDRRARLSSEHFQLENDLTIATHQEVNNRMGMQYTRYVLTGIKFRDILEATFSFYILTHPVATCPGHVQA